MAFDPTKDYITREEKFLTVMAGNSDINFPEPITRFEHYLAAMCDPDNYPAPAPITRLEHYLSAIAQKISEGGGGGGGSWELIKSEELTVSTTNTSSTKVADIALPDDFVFSAGDLIVVHIRDNAGKRDNYFYGSESIFSNSTIASEAKITNSTPAINGFYVSSSSAYGVISSKYGVFADSLSYVNKAIAINSRYNSANSKTIDGTFMVYVYKVTPPFTMFA